MKSHEDFERMFRRLGRRDPDWSPLRPEEVIVEIDIAGDEAYMRRVARIIGDRVDAKVNCGHFYGHDAHDLEFLRFLPGLRRIYVSDHGLVSLDGLRHLSDEATSIEIGPTWKPVSLRPLGRFRGLRTLYLDGQRRDIAVIGELTGLEDLTLRSVTLPDLSILLPLVKLRSLDIKLGGTKDLRLLPQIGRLEYLELWLILGLIDIDAIGDVVTLESLFLQSLKRVTHLPSFRRLGRLKTVHLESLAGVTDLSGVAEAPALDLIRLVGFSRVSPDIVRPFIGHPTLREAAWGLGGIKKSFAAQALVPLDPELTDRDEYERSYREAMRRAKGR